MSAEEPRALSVRTAPVPSSWDVYPWIPPRGSSSPELPVTLGSPSPYIDPSGVFISSSLKTIYRSSNFFFHSSLSRAIALYSCSSAHSSL